MSEPIERPTSVQPAYVVWLLLFIASIFALQFVVAGLLLYAFYGIPTYREVTTMRQPEYSHSVLWKNRVVYPVMESGPEVAPNTGTLKSFDPEKGDPNETFLFQMRRGKDADEFKVTIPVPIFGLLAQGDRLWSVSPHNVVLIEGQKKTEFTPKRVLTRACEPFEYEGQLAIVDMVKNGRPKLLVFVDNEWDDVGDVVIPMSFAKSKIDGHDQLVPGTAGNARSASLMDLQVISQDGQLHLFASDRAIIACRHGLELATASALSPDNDDEVTDLSNLADWEFVCDVPPSGLVRAKNSWKAGFVDGEPVVFALFSTASPQNPFQNGSLLAHSRSDRTWKKSGEISLPAAAELLVVSDQQKNYVAGYSLMGQLLRIHTVTQQQILPTEAVVKAPVAGFLPAYIQLISLSQWVYWPCLLVFAMGVSRLIRSYRGTKYQFGVSQVEFASFLRRGLARTIDYLPFILVWFLIATAFGISSREQGGREADKLFANGVGGLLVPLIWMLFCNFMSTLFLVIINSWLQGRWGMTLGKWLCGIRTVRSTLRPCGFSRAFVRELLLPAETLMGTTCLPATFLIAFTNFQQRLGDWAADTIVIRAQKPNE
jgi:uncharacterized RDD family membrane protein YckC